MIREFLGVTEATVEDGYALTQWLETQVLAYDLKFESLKDAATKRLRDLKIELPTPERLERIIRSAIRAFEQNFCQQIAQQLPTAVCQKLDQLLQTNSSESSSELTENEEIKENNNIYSPLAILKRDPGRLGLDSLISEAEKLNQLRQLELPSHLFQGISDKVLQVYQQRVAVEPPRELRRHPDNLRYTLSSAFCWLRTQEITDKLVDLLIQIIHRIGARAERRVTKELVEDFKKVNGKTGILFQLAEAAISKPEGIVKDVIYSVVGEQTLLNLVREFKSTGTAYREKVHTIMRSSYSNHYRRMLPFLLNHLEFRSNNERHKPVISALELLKKYIGSKEKYYNSDEIVPTEGIVNASLAELIIETAPDGSTKINRINYELAVLKALRDGLRCKEIWGEGTTTCASDSKKFGAWDQNLMTEWHIRYGGRGVMIYWHVDKNSTCIYSQLKSCSSSEVAAMIEGLLRHCTEMKIEKNYVDSHGQSEVAFAFCHLLGFNLMPRLKGIHHQKLYLPHTGQSNIYPHLKPILTRPINWDLIRQQYDQMIKYATALRLGTAETEAILKRFTRSNLTHPTYRALAELGKVIKTIFLCEYLNSEPLRREVNEALNVVESWNNANGFIFFGKGKEIATNRLEDQEIAVLSLHLLQSCLVYVNTLIIQEVLGETAWRQKMKPNDLKALTPLIWSHVNPYGTFRLNLDERLPLKMVA